MTINAIADDIELNMVCIDGKVLCTVKDTAYDISPTAGKSKKFMLEPDQAAATMALFVAGDLEDSQLNEKLYEITGPAWNGVEQAFRPIP